MTSSPLIFFFIIAYLALVIAVGLVITKKKVKNSDDFAVANRSLPAIVLIGTLMATWSGAGGITGYAGLFWKNGPFVATLVLMGNPIGMMLLYSISSRVRRATTYTIPELFEIRYGTSARVLATLCIVLGYVGILASQFKAAGMVINLTTGFDQETAVIISGIAMVILAVTGGMVSVAYTDALSAFIFAGGFLAAVPFLAAQIDGGFIGMFSNLPAGRDSLSGSLTLVQALGYLFPVFFLVLGDQGLIQRVGAAKSVKTARRSCLGLVLSNFVICPLIISMTTAAIYLIPELERPETVIFQLALRFVPPVIGGLVMAACMAFIVTTGDSYILSISSNITYDIWGRFIRKNASDREKLIVLRIAAASVAVFAYAMGRFFPDILSVQMYAYSMYGASITPALICALFSKKVTKIGGLSGILVGGVGTLIWEVALRSPFGIKSAIIIVPITFAVIFLVSSLTQSTEKVPLEKVLKADLAE